MVSTPANGSAGVPADGRNDGPIIGTSLPSVSGDWPAQAADLVVNTVDAVRDRTTGTILSIARVTVFGLLVVLLGLVMVVMAIVLLVRLLDAILPSSVWLPYLVLGLASLFGGFLVFRRRHPAGNTATS
jgi:vacuolar-type H+-ATPase subunit I/STV1